MNLKIGGSNVGKIMYNGQEFGGATKLEPGTILYMSETREISIKSVHLLSTTKNWNNINGINVRAYDKDFSQIYVDVDIPSDNFKNVDINKPYKTNSYTDSVNISTSIVDGEYRLNTASIFVDKFIITAI
ncbi:hypothetical protein ACROUK_01130 [Companilactobacillus alimentarius]|uniref:hypothetical protein n=1 Tax=Companilactobacillus alimentarius TaxID=1602 RepID=UPI003D7E997C